MADSILNGLAAVTLPIQPSTDLVPLARGAADMTKVTVKDLTDSAFTANRLNSIHDANANSRVVRLQRAINNAYKNNYLDSMPWAQPVQWVSGMQFTGCDAVKNSNGDLYFMLSDQGTMTSTVQPVHRTHAGVAGGDGIVWLYQGNANSYLPIQASSNPPVSSTDNMDGLIYAGQTSGGWTTAGASINGFIMTTPNAAAGIALGDPVTGTGVASGTMILSLASGTLGAAGATYNVSVTQNVGPIQLSWAGYLTGCGSVWGLTKTVTLSAFNSVMPVTPFGGKLSVWSATGCSITGGVLTIGALLAGSTPILPDIGIWTGSQGINIISQLTGTTGGVGTYQLGAGAINQASFACTNSCFPRPTTQSNNGGTLATPSYGDVHVGIQFKTNAKWLGFNTTYGLGAQYFIHVVVNGKILCAGNIHQKMSYSANQGFFLLDLGKLCNVDGESEVTIYTKALGNTGIARFFMGATDYITPVYDDTNLSLVVEGDSTTQGARPAVINAESKFAYRLAARLGIQQVYSNAVGGTGFIAPGAGTTYIQRLPWITAMDPDVVIIMGAINDANQSRAAMLAVVSAYITAFRTAMGADVLLFITGNRCLLGTNISVAQISELGIQDAVIAANDPKIFFIPILTATDGDGANGWYAGGSVSGKYFYTNGSTLTDSHPSITEYSMVTNRVAAAIRNIMNGFLDI